MKKRMKQSFRKAAGVIMLTGLACGMLACNQGESKKETETTQEKENQTLNLDDLDRIDVFEGIELVLNREGKLELNCMKAKMDYFEYSLEQKENIKNGDKIKVSVEKDMDEFYAKVYGWLPDEYECELEVKGLAEDALNDNSQGTASSEKNATTDERGQQIEIDDSTFVFPYSDERLLTDQDINSLTEKTAKIARNELYARHGYIFKDGGEMKAHFDNKKYPWYQNMKDKTKDMSEAEERFNSVEIANLRTIINKEKEMHWNNQK